MGGTGIRGTCDLEREPTGETFPGTYRGREVHPSSVYRKTTEVQTQYGEGPPSPDPKSEYDRSPSTSNLKGVVHERDDHRDTRPPCTRRVSKILR